MTFKYILLCLLLSACIFSGLSQNNVAFYYSFYSLFITNLQTLVTFTKISESKYCTFIFKKTCDYVKMNNTRTINILLTLALWVMSFKERTWHIFWMGAPIDCTFREVQTRGYRLPIIFRKARTNKSTREIIEINGVDGGTGVLTWIFSMCSRVISSFYWNVELFFKVITYHVWVMKFILKCHFYFPWKDIQILKKFI